MSPLAPRSLAVLALQGSCAGRGTGDSAPHPVRPAGLPIVVPAVLGLTALHPALVFHQTSPRPIPSGGPLLSSPCELVANQEECDCRLVPGHVSRLPFRCVFCYHPFRT